MDEMKLWLVECSASACVVRAKSNDEARHIASQNNTLFGDGVSKPIEIAERLLASEIPIEGVAELIIGYDKGYSLR